MILEGDLANWQSAGVSDDPQAAQLSSEMMVTATPFL
jgi:hypothetical protein